MAKGNNGLTGRVKYPRLMPTIRPTMPDIYQAAGLYEGEGCVSKGGQVVVGQKDPEILYWLRERFGGNVRKADARGYSFHVWEATGVLGRGFLMTIFSRLSRRRKEQIKNALTGRKVSTVASSGNGIQ